MLKQNVNSSPLFSKKIRLGVLKIKSDEQSFPESHNVPAATGSTPPRGRSLVAQNLNFGMQQQQQTQWCWSAVATSTSLFYSSSSSWTQCNLANQQLSQTTCCQNGGNSSCNQPWDLDSALQAVGDLNYWVSGTVAFSIVQQEVNGSRPLGVRIGWSGSGGHFVILDGYNTSGGQFLSARDPWYGSSTYSYANFSSRYQGSGSWTHTLDNRSFIMSLKSGNPPASALQVIAEAANNLIALPQEAESVMRTFGNNPENAEIAAPLEVYTLDLPDVIENNLNSSQATGWRYTLLQENEPIAAAEVDALGGGEEVIFSHFNSGPFVEETVKTIIQAENLDEVADKDYEARILKIPALYVMALWLNNETDDILIPISPTNENLEPEKLYSPDEFFARLANAAHSRLEFNDSPRDDKSPTAGL